MEDKSSSSMLDETSVFSEEMLESSDVLCLYGFEKSPALLEEWLQMEGKYIIHFCADPEGALFEEEEKIRHVSLQDGHVDFEAFKQICKEMLFLRFSYAIHPALKEDLDQIIARCQRIQWQTHLFASDYKDFGVKILSNVRKNLCNANKYAVFESLRGALKNIPAVICGAGPSLNENIPWLHKIANHAVIFGGGASLPILSRAHVPFHLAAGIDPDPCYARFFEHSAFEVPFMYQDRISSEILSLVHGPLIQIPSSGGYELELWLRQEMGLGLEPFDGGWTVATLCTALAGYLGCNPIVFSGMDFAYPLTSSMYAEGVREDKEVEGIRITDEISGDLLSKRDWMMAAKWLEEYMAVHSDRRFYLASQTGLSLKGAIRCSLEALLQSDFKHQNYDIAGLIHSMREQFVYKESDRSKRALLLEQVDKSLVKVEEICNHLLSLFEKHYPEDPREKGEFILSLYDLYDELIYQKLLDPLWKIWKYPIERKVGWGYERDIHQLLFFKKIIAAHNF